MNRHSPLFRVAFISLLMAISLPLLVFTAAQVRQRQLRSKANPRWAAFSKVNGVKNIESADAGVQQTGKPSVEVPAPEQRESPRLQTVLASKSTAVDESPKDDLQRTLELPRIEVPPVESLVAQDKPRKSTVQRTEPKPNHAVPNPRPRPQIAERQPKSDLSSTRFNAPVPLPDDQLDSEPVSPNEIEVVQVPQFQSQKPTQKLGIVFKTTDETKPQGDSTTGRLEARLASMQRRLDQLAQAQVDKQLSDFDRALDTLQKVQQGQSQSQQAPAPGPIDNPEPQPAPVRTPTSPPPPAPMLDSGTGTTGKNNNGSRREPSIKIIQGDLGDNDERFSIQVQDANITEVLDMLGQLAGVNILASPNVQGRISLNLQDVTVDRALEAVLKSQGFVHERDGDIIYIRTGEEESARKVSNRKLITKVYQLNYISANELQKLISPMLTKGVGTHAVTSPSLVGIAPTPTAAGGDGFAQRDTLLVQDYPEIIAEVDRVIIEIDVPPLQVMIEAKILSVTLSDSMQFGVNFAMLNGASNSQLLTGNGSTLNGSTGFPKNPVLAPAAGPAGDFIANTAGLKYGFIQGDISGFIEALESIADTTLVASPQLRVLNKQKAEMIIGERLSYKTLAFNGTQTVENVQFLDAGTKLIFRPFISPGGLVRLEVHPERSKATINAQTGLPNSETTEVTTNVMVRDGTTVVLGGLISEEVTESIDRVPLLGAIPVIGTAFQNKNEVTTRTELIVLITPRIVVEPEAAIEGEKLQFETEARAAHFRDNLSSVNRASLTRAHYERACTYFEQGNLLKAKQQIDAALYQNKGDLECQRMKLKIEKSLRDQQAKAWRWPRSTRTVQRP